MKVVSSQLILNRRSIICLQDAKIFVTQTKHGMCRRWSGGIHIRLQTVRFKRPGIFHIAKLELFAVWALTLITISEIRL